MVKFERGERCSPGFLSFAAGYSGRIIPLEALAGRWQTRRTMASLEQGLVNERLRLLSSADACSLRDAEVRADLALMAVGLIDFHEKKGMVRCGRVFSRVRQWQIDQAQALVNLSSDELCQEALWRVDTLPRNLIEIIFDITLRGIPGEPAILPVTICDFWNAGLFSTEQITAARMLECRSRTVEWLEKRCARDPRIALAYLRTLETRLRDRKEAVVVHKLLRRVEDAMPFWKEGYQLGEEFFRDSNGELDGGMRTGLQVIVQHLYEIQQDQEFPWRAIIDEKALGIVWQHDSQGSERS
ncbi:hypothetical protein [Sansalvadorimonas verongulae]|uniref:hypothetical protein n=1 Tax=Sansalvadorimonas verongulae TaxID=2172824 RepID=UPI0012BD0162|nr:hypothetical protein [Sansalvadorimonas verongulae]MTI12917.1 hypothetical protein [Sansalvadorimonas verongulae]